MKEFHDDTCKDQKPTSADQFKVKILFSVTTISQVKYRFANMDFYRKTRGDK